MRWSSLLYDARFTIYEDEREMIITSVSTCGLQRQSNEGEMIPRFVNSMTSKSKSKHVDVVKICPVEGDMIMMDFFKYFDHKERVH